nr:hypothetical protein [Aquicoccus sp. G2-2]MEA1111997.1 hypothetical protein [Aquicoccus sp. G2-2]
MRLSSQIAFYAITVAGAYGALNILLLMASPFLLGWSIAAKTAVTVPPMVVVMIHVVVPIAVRAKARILAHC